MSTRDGYHDEHFHNALWRFRAEERALGHWIQSDAPSHSDVCKMIVRQVEDLDSELGKMRHHAPHVEYPYPDDMEDVPSPSEYQRMILDDLRTAEETLKAVSKKIATKCVRAT